MGESQLQLGVATVPPATSFSVSESHDPNAAISLVEREGDITDDIIENIVASVTSSSDNEEGEVEGEGEGEGGGERDAEREREEGPEEGEIGEGEDILIPFTRFLSTIYIHII